eukprot:CAMPEP_0118636354 /NCGR_PEP_ID=MMETSP0785-20121206/2575_1 /TAXON_ID=91992 /ORGANISM="Bolidomonas pacifica, Strain CCMP 1866" /LENGTH=346 /DNA_ID=CAMNT_0006527469 /DNA_START=38 /DNA_END=1078 /DNA_ORIENTATION=+
MISADDTDSLCITPGTCQPPSDLDYKVFGRIDAVPRKQWGDSGGFCGALSIQVIGMSYGVWHSQDVIRKQAPASDPLGHGDDEEGYEILHSNVDGALENLGFEFESWDYTQPTPHGEKYLSWLKEKLAADNGVVQFVICKGDHHNSYGPFWNPVPYDHVEPFFSMYSVAPDDDVRDDDIVVHGSDYSPDGKDNFGYFRSFNSLLDDLDMQGNCADAGSGYGKNEMYPCIYSEQTYGTAISAIKGLEGDLKVSLTVNTTDEADVREDEPPTPLEGTLKLRGLEVGKSYVLKRFDGLATFPMYSNEPSFVYNVQGTDEEFVTFVDPQTFISNNSTLYMIEEAEDAESK